LTASENRDPRLAEPDRAPEGSGPDEAAWYDRLRALLEDSYLAADNPRGQSGFGGDEDYWERARRPITRAIHGDGSFLDVGCANGLLMESVVRWAHEGGHEIEPYGLDLSPRLADLARRRLPEWADRIYTGNVVDWHPPRRFDFVRTGLDTVPAHRQPRLVERLLRELAAPGGRLIVCSYGSSRPEGIRAEPVGERLGEWGYQVAGETEGTAPNGAVVVRVAWIEAPQARTG
jgi:SAM-dependent methyltransferase